MARKVFGDAAASPWLSRPIPVSFRRAHNSMNSIHKRETPDARLSIVVEIAACFAIVATFLFAIGCTKRDASDASNGAAKSKRIPIAAVTKAVRCDLSKQVVFDAEFRPFQDIDLHAHVAGFVQQMNVDVGSLVRSGQVVAVIEIPEFKEEFERSQALRTRAAGDVTRAEEEVRRAELDVGKNDAALKRAEAAYAEARMTFDRLAAVSKSQPGLVAQQELDVAQARERTASAQVEEAKAGQAAARAGVSVAKIAVISAKDAVAIADADVHRLQAKLAFTKITAPFDGRITKRIADVGDIVRGGLSPSSPAVALARLVTVDKLRLAFPVSASYLARVKAGQKVSYIVPELGKTFEGTVTRVAGEVDAATRSMEAQVDVMNPDGTLIPGMFAQVTLQLEHHERVVAVPATAVSRSGPPNVLVIGPDNLLTQRKVATGIETASQIEIVSGLKEGELVFVGSRTQIKPGQQVEPKIVEILNAE
jgi:RND family efflux transporter MFP subunit